MSDEKSDSSFSKDEKDEVEEERKPAAVESQDVTRPTATDALRRQSGLHQQMAKDPLDLGVPFPVLVSRPLHPSEEGEATTLSAAHAVLPSSENSSLAATAAAARPCASVADSGDPDRARKAKEEASSLRNWNDKSRSGVTEATPSSKSQDLERGRRSTGVRRMSSPSRHRSEVDQEGFMDMMEPGSYAIGGPGLSVPNPPSVGGEEESYRLDLEEGQEDNIEPCPGHHCSTETCTTTRISVSLCSHQSCSEVSSDYLVEATLVPEDQDEDASAVIQAEAKPLPQRILPAWALLCGCCLVSTLIIVGVMIGLAFLFEIRNGGELTDENSSLEAVLDSAVTLAPSLPPLSPNITPPPPPPPSPTIQSPSPAPVVHQPALERVRKSGILRCGITSESQAFQQGNQTDGNFSSNFATNYCRAISAAILGHGNSSYEVISVPSSHKLEALSNRSVDVFVLGTSMSMEEAVYQDGSDNSLAFSIPYLYAGFGSVGLPFYVDCADADVKTFSECDGIRICLDAQSHLYESFSRRIPRGNLIVRNGTSALLEMFMDGACNVIATAAAPALEIMLRSMGYQGDLAIGTREFTSGMWALTSLDSDPEWTSFLSVLTLGLIAAEEAQIGRDEATKMGQTSLFGDAFNNMLVDALKESGNMGAIYDLPIPRKAKNLLNTGSSGLLASPPLGDVEDAWHNPNRIPISCSSIETIRNRGKLYCGIRGGRPGFAYRDTEQEEWKGIDVDFCLALAASIFNGNTQAIHFRDVTPSNGFVELHHGFIDVFAGAEWTLENDVHENNTGVGFSFTQPYFYGPLNDTRFEENLALATRETDPKWSSFVYWAAQSLVYAEENDIVQQTSSQMPLVYCFGYSLQRMFRDAVHAVGNYHEVYERNVAMTLLRSGRNMLNLLQDNLPLRYIPPGLPDRMY